MSNTSLRILIADSNALIALDLERILVESHGCEVTICTRNELPVRVLRATYDIVMIDAVLSPDINEDNAQAVLLSGARPVFLTSFDDFPQAFPKLADLEVLAKPFDPAQVSDLISRLRERA